jgi:hypothetical protein
MLAFVAGGLPNNDEPSRRDAGGETMLSKALARWRRCFKVVPFRTGARNLSSVMRTIGLALSQTTLLFALLALGAGAEPRDPPVLEPAPNTHSAPVTTSILIRFGPAIDPMSVSTRTIPVHGTQQGLVAGTYAVVDRQVQLTPSRPFFPGELVQGVVTTHTQSISGSAIAKPIVWQFRTAVGAGAGTFVEGRSGLDSTWSEAVASGDLDADGDLDIFLGQRDDASTVWLNDGTGQFTTTGLDFGNAFLIDVALGDLDGDGDLDAILAGIQDNVFFWNDGQGAFSYGGEIFAGSRIIPRVVLGDLDGDGDLDAVTVTVCDPFDPDQGCTYSTNPIWSNDGAGRFLPSGQSLGVGSFADAALGDLDGDGDLDAVVVSTVQGVYVWQNSGSGVFSNSQTLSDTVAASVDLGDLDGDGDLDAFLASQSSASSAVLLNGGGGAFTPGQQLGTLGPAVLGDLDGDGDLDAFSCNDGADKVWLNRGDATFVFSGQALGTTTSTGVALGDLDGDGDLDALTSGYNVEPTLWINMAPPPARAWLPLVAR